MRTSPHPTRATTHTIQRPLLSLHHMLGEMSRGLLQQLGPNRYLDVSVLSQVENQDEVMSSLPVKWRNTKTFLVELNKLSNIKGLENRLTEGKCVHKSLLVYYY